MTINAIKIKLFGKVGTVYRVLDNNGEVIHVAETEAAAQAWIDNK